MRALLPALLLAGCATSGLPLVLNLDLVDPARDRPIPVRLHGRARRPLVLLSHGYGGTNADHDFIAEALAARGFLVASLQHELAGDPPMPTSGSPAVVRRPFWAQGVVNLAFVADALAARGLADGDAPLIL